MSRQFSSETRDMPPSDIQQDTNEEHRDPSHSSTALEEISDYNHGKIASSNLNNVDYMGFIQMISVLPRKTILKFHNLATRRQLSN